MRDNPIHQQGLDQLRSVVSLVQKRYLVYAHVAVARKKVRPD